MKMYQLSRFSFGKATSFAPIIKGMRKLPSTAGIEGARKKKIITRPCRVNILLYVDGSMREPCGSIRFKRIRVQPGDPFVIRGEKPGFPSVTGVEIMDPRQNADFLHCLTHGFAAFRSSASGFASD